MIEYKGEVTVLVLFLYSTLKMDLGHFRSSSCETPYYGRVHSGFFSIHPEVAEIKCDYPERSGTNRISFGNYLKSKMDVSKSNFYKGILKCPSNQEHCKSLYPRSENKLLYHSTDVIIVITGIVIIFVNLPFSIL